MTLQDVGASIHAQLILRLLVAATLGAVVGYERERNAAPAGIRTHGMVCLGAALFTVVSLHGFEGRGEPNRIAAMIVSGIGFIGAGAILRSGTSVRGLTTAATLWVTAAIGMAVGVGMMVISLATTAIIFVFLSFGPRLASTKVERGEEGEANDSE
jgi:putative Mg2+ transporter-C (MgtC) family protein